MNVVDESAAGAAFGEIERASVQIAITRVIMEERHDYCENY